jgi:hypothetical protein
MNILNLKECFQKQPPELDFVLPGMIKGTVGALISPGGAGKSMWALQTAIQIASGFDSLENGAKPVQGKVYYLAAEDPETALHHRLYAIGKSIDPSTYDVIEHNLTISTPDGEPIDLLAPDSETKLSEELKDHRLLIIDTLRRVHSKNENDSGEMAAVIAKMEWIAARTGVSVLFLHHSTKSAALSGQVGEQQSSRGSSVLVDNVRWQGFLATMSKEEAKRYSISEEERKFFVKFGVSKQNYCSPIADVWYRRHPGGVLRREDLQCSKGSRRRVEDGN